MSTLTQDKQPLPLRVRGWLDRTLANPGFRRWAAAFPLTRPLARKRSQELFDLCAGFVYSQTLFAVVELGLPELLLESPRGEAEIAARARLTPEAVRRLMKAAGALDLVAERGPGHWGLGGLGAALANNPGVQAMVRHHAMLYADLRDPVALLRGEAGDTAIGRYWPYAGQADVDEAGAAGYSELMAASQDMIAEQVIAAYPLNEARAILDLGGGEGRFLEHVARACPNPRLTLFDLPAVAARARDRFGRAGLAARIDTVGGSFLDDALPGGHDLITLVRILHDHDDEPVLTLLTAARAALADGGRLLIAEPVSGRVPGARIADAYFGLYLLAMGSGRARDVAEHRALLRRAGFARARVIDTHLPHFVRLIEARP